MKNQYEITLDNKDKTSPVKTITVSIEGMDRIASVLYVEEQFTNFTIRYIIAIGR